jgi:hypothetical protein
MFCRAGYAGDDLRDRCRQCITRIMRNLEYTLMLAAYDELSPDASAPIHC